MPAVGASPQSGALAPPALGPDKFSLMKQAQVVDPK
jgi:hypothetical protein